MVALTFQKSYNGIKDLTKIFLFLSFVALPNEVKVSVLFKFCELTFYYIGEFWDSGSFD